MFATIRDVKVGILGTRGVPALYGGFETAVEEVGQRLASYSHDVTVYCRNPDQSETEYRGMHLVNLPAIRQRYLETLSHTAVSACHATLFDRPDVVLVFNAGNAPFLRPMRFMGLPVAIHLDGLESQRDKWRGIGSAYYRWAEGAAVRAGDEVIVDSQAIAEYVVRTYDRTPTFIAYGAQVFTAKNDRLVDLGVSPGEFHLLVSRMEPENHVLEAIRGYRASDETKPLIVVGSAPYSQQYIDNIRENVREDSRIRLLGSVYDQELLDQMYGNCRTYFHGHSVGGTNPSLLRAMGAGAPVLAFDCEFNREVTAGNALYWSDPQQITTLLNAIAIETLDSTLREFSSAGRDRVRQKYQWDQVAREYEELLARMLANRRRGENS